MTSRSELINRQRLHNCPGFEHSDPVANPEHRDQVMRDIEKRGAVIAVQSLEQVNDLGLRYRVERAGGFVGNDQRRSSAAARAQSARAAPGRH